MKVIYSILFYEEKENGYSAFIPDLNNASTCGDTLQGEMEMTESFETSIEINSYLIFGAECDTIQEWYNQSNTETKIFLKKLWDGNIATWTQENMEKHVIARGGQLEMGKEDVVFYFRRKLRKDIRIKDIVFLIALTLK